MPFLFNIEIIHPRQYNIQLRFASLNINYLRWIIFDIKQKGMEHLVNIAVLLYYYYHYCNIIYCKFLCCLKMYLVVYLNNVILSEVRV